MKRCSDILIIIFLAPFLFLPVIIICLGIKATSRGPILYWSKRVGKGNRVFLMPKFRTMKIQTPEVASHLLKDAQKFLTPIGSFLRNLSLDELPQLWSIFRGDMTIVGPRPALFNQYDLIKLRNQYGVSQLIPGLTGWAQINGRDFVSVPEKVQLDVYYLQNHNWKLDFKIIILTIYYAVKRVDISH